MTHVDGPGTCDVSPVQAALLIIQSHLNDSQGAKVQAFVFLKRAMSRSVSAGV